MCCWEEEDAGTPPEKCRNRWNVSLSANDTPSSPLKKREETKWDPFGSARQDVEFVLASFVHLAASFSYRIPFIISVKTPSIQISYLHKSFCGTHTPLVERPGFNHAALVMISEDSRLFVICLRTMAAGAQVLYNLQNEVIIYADRIHWEESGDFSFLGIIRRVEPSANQKSAWNKTYGLHYPFMPRDTVECGCVIFVYLFTIIFFFFFFRLVIDTFLISKRDGNLVKSYHLSRSADSQTLGNDIGDVFSTDQRRWLFQRRRAVTEFTINLSFLHPFHSLSVPLQHHTHYY